MSSQVKVQPKNAAQVAGEVPGPLTIKLGEHGALVANFRTFQSGKDGYGAYGKANLPGPDGLSAFQVSINIVRIVK